MAIKAYADNSGYISEEGIVAGEAYAVLPARDWERVVALMDEQMEMPRPQQPPTPFPLSGTFAEMRRQMANAELIAKSILHLEEAEEINRLLREMYGIIWCEASYDPTNEVTQKYAKRLLPHIKRLNEIIKFKK